MWPIKAAHYFFVLKFAFLHPEENTVEIKDLAPFIPTVFSSGCKIKIKTPHCSHLLVFGICFFIMKKTY